MDEYLVCVILLTTRLCYKILILYVCYKYLINIILKIIVILM